MATKTKTELTSYGFKFDPHKFCASEIFSNNNGKTSSTKIVGFIASMVCLFLFILLVIFYLITPAECLNILALIDRTTTYFTVSAGLMGIKSVTSAFGKQKIEISNTEGVQRYTTYGSNSESTEETEETENSSEEQTA